MDSKKTEEIFPLVDTEGNVVGKATRNQCHSGSMLLHPVIHLHIFNSKGELFLQKRSMKKDIESNKWDSSVGGHIDLGETPEIAALREAKEEIGLSLQEIHFIDKYIIETEKEKELTYVFFTETDANPTIDKDEVSDGRFWTIEEIKESIGKNIFTPNFELDFDRFLQYGISFLNNNYI